MLDYTNNFLTPLWNSLSLDLLFTCLLACPTNDPVACLLLLMSIYINWNNVFEITWWLNLLYSLAELLVILFFFTFIVPILYFSPVTDELSSLLIIIALSIIVLFSCFNWNNISDTHWWIRLILLTLVLIYVVCVLSLIIYMYLDSTIDSTIDSTNGINEITVAIMDLVLDDLPAALHFFYDASFVNRSVACLLFAWFMSSNLHSNWLFRIIPVVLIATTLSILVILFVLVDDSNSYIIFSSVLTTSGLLWLGFLFCVCCVILWYFW